MNFLNFIKEKLFQLLLLLFSIATIEIFFVAYHTKLFIKIYTMLVILITYFVCIFIEYFKKKKYYDNFYNILDKLDEKYLINEIISEPSFIEGKILKNSLDEIDKSMHENVNKYKYLQQEYKEYIELWIHEIKLPIATSKMIIENNKSKVTKSIDEEIDKIENYVEQALFYARSTTVEKDYYIKKCMLKEIVNESIKKNKTNLIQEKVNINTHNLENVVNTDSKWVVFILNQIIQNSLKYKNKSKALNLEIYSTLKKDSIILYVKDNGIGISDSELLRVFEKGFTGTNGRLSGKKSTGIGLYLCKRLCDKLNLLIKIKSKQNIGTTVMIIFPNSSYVNLK